MNTITVTSTADSGKGSLRAAIASSKAGDSIRFAKKLTGKTITLKSGQLVLDKSITIDGSGARGLTISGNQSSRVFYLDKKRTATLKNLTIANGKTLGAGGGIDTRHESTLNLINVDVKNNTSELGGGLRVGHMAKANIINSRFVGNNGLLTQRLAGFSAGAIAHNESRGQIRIKGSTFENNKGGTGGALYGMHAVTFIVEDSVFRKNSATRKGGAIFTDGVSAKNYEGPPEEGTITVRGSRFENNTANGAGGALYFWGYGPDKGRIEDSVFVGNQAIPDSTGRAKGGAVWAKMGLDIRNVTFAKNTATQQGGALWTETKLPINILNSTFSGNRVQQDAGGALFLKNFAAPVKITNSTIAYNHAERANGAIWLAKNHNVTLKNSIVAFNTAKREPKKNQVGNPPKDGGGNLEYSPYAKSSRVFSKGVVADPRLNALKTINGALIHSLKAGSAAIDSGVNSGAPKTDQRGISRDRRIDIGAFESSSSQPAVSTPVSAPPTPSSPTTRPRPLAVDQKLVAHLNLNEGKGVRAQDSSPAGGKNPGTLVGNPRWTTGMKQGAVDFDGKGDLIKLNSSNDINLKTHKERTVSLWFKADNINTGNQRQVLYEEGGRSRGANIYLHKGHLYVGGWNTPKQESGWSGTWLKTNKISANKWHHVDLVLEGGTQVKEKAFHGFLDGRKFDSGKGSQLWGHGAGIGVGGVHNGTLFHDGFSPNSGSGFAGAIDDVRVFNDALTANEIKTFL
ncbi:MAG: choice-of-anchor Q domain-containing protein [Cyanobacteria bacterium J06634_5]